MHSGSDLSPCAGGTCCTLISLVLQLPPSGFHPCQRTSALGPHVSAQRVNSSSRWINNPLFSSCPYDPPPPMASDDQNPLSTTYPPDIGCFSGAPYWAPWIFQELNCSVTNNMVNYLNLTGPDVKSYLTVYCLNAPSDDVCPFGFCPNPDIAGPLVRIASESTRALGWFELWC